MERWTADGVRGRSAVFLTENVAGNDDAALRSLLNITGATTGKREDRHTFLNFDLRRFDKESGWDIKSAFSFQTRLAFRNVWGSKFQHWVPGPAGCFTAGGRCARAGDLG